MVGHRGAGNFFCRAPSLFLALQQLVVLVSAFVMVSTDVSFIVCCSSTHSAPPCPAICKSKGNVPPCPIESAPLVGHFGDNFTGYIQRPTNSVQALKDKKAMYIHG